MLIDYPYKHYLDPWPHMVIDNFYEDEIWEYVMDRKALINKFRSQARKEDNGVSLSKIEDETLLAYFKRKLPISFLKSVFHNHRHFDSLSPTNTLKISNVPKFFGIHDEHPEKVFSCTTYIAPSHNVGTVLYNSKKEVEKIVTWKPNRAIVFAPIDNVTWHNFGSWEELDRYTVDFFWTKPYF